MSHIYPQDFKYGVIHTVDLATLDFDETRSPTSPTSLRYALADSQFRIKWEEGHQPGFITNGTVVPASILSWADCNALMQTPAWSEPEPPIEE